MSSVSVTISAIQEPNWPLKGETAASTETVTLPSIGAFTPPIKSFYFQLYGGSGNNNDQIVQDWKSA
jgi:hypothetical protein